MAAGDNYFTCNFHLGTEQAIREMIYDDGAGNPVLHTDPAGTALLPYFDCEEKNALPLEQVFRAMILEDANGKPYLNTTTS